MLTAGQTLISIRESWDVALALGTPLGFVSSGWTIRHQDFKNGDFFGSNPAVQVRTRESGRCVDLSRRR